MRRKLREFYGAGEVSGTGPIPVHLLGNMWGLSWNNVYDIVTPFPSKTSIDITPEMIRSGMTAKEMAEIAESFYVSLGFPKLPQEFWDGSILEKPKDREIICHASAWDLHDGNNFWCEYLKAKFQTIMPIDVLVKKLFKIPDVLLNRQDKTMHGSKYGEPYNSSS